MEEFILSEMPAGSSRRNSFINRKIILRILGILLFIEAALFLVCMGVSLLYREADYIYFIYAAVINVVVGGIMFFWDGEPTTWLHGATAIAWWHSHGCCSPCSA